MAHNQLQAPEQGKIRLILYRPATSESLDSFYLDIPTSIPPILCQRPRKYLRYLGWCIPGIDGQVAMDSPRLEPDIGNEGPLEDRGVYRYYDPLRYAIDPSVINLRSTVASGQSSHSGTSTLRQEFCAELAERDACCVFTCHPRYQAMDIIPFARPDEASLHHISSYEHYRTYVSQWFQLIVASRLTYGEDVSDLNSVNDIRNGMSVVNFIHSSFDSQDYAILKTPNHVLSIEDMPVRHERNLVDEVDYPASARFTLHLLEDGPRRAHKESNFPWNGRDAVFKTGTNLPKPSDLLLHYSYGAAAVKRWGQPRRFLSDCKNVPCPQAAVAPGPSGPSTTVHDRSGVTTRKRERAPDTAGSSKGKRPHPETWRAVDGSTGWDGDEWMLFFCSNTKRARERHQELSSRINKWASEVSHG
ncbi:hypothetical protein BJV78DRAFT_1130395 [Lactifluus subvellereus]|nr:hypothetical protein BJV78DRAFT_1130395 [Lactifluus subvellereus]